MVPIIYNAGNCCQSGLSLDSSGSPTRGAFSHRRHEGEGQEGRYDEGHGSRLLDLINVASFTVF